MMNVEQRHERQRTGEAMLNFEIQKMLDLFGKAILDYQIHNSPEDLITETSIFL